MRPVPLALLVLLAGCLAPAAPEPAPSQAPQPEVLGGPAGLDFVGTGCSKDIFFLTTDGDSLAPYMPPDFDHTLVPNRVYVQTCTDATLNGTAAPGPVTLLVHDMPVGSNGTFRYILSLATDWPALHAALAPLGAPAHLLTFERRTDPVGLTLTASGDVEMLLESRVDEPVRAHGGGGTRYAWRLGLDLSSALSGQSRGDIADSSYTDALVTARGGSVGAAVGDDARPGYYLGGHGSIRVWQA